MGYKPTINEILTWRTQLASANQALASAARAEEELYFQQFTMSVPTDYPSVRTGSAPADVDQGVEAIQPSDWVGVTVTPAFDTDIWQTLADKRSMWLRSLLAYWREDVDVLNAALWGMFVHRRRFARIGILDLPPELEKPLTIKASESADEFMERVNIWENRRNRHVPFTFELLPMGTVMTMEDARGGIEYLFEYYSRTVADLRRWYPPDKYPAVARRLENRDLTEEVAFSSFWSADWRCAFIEDDPILNSTEKDEYKGLVPNDQGIVPFVEFFFRKLPVEELNRRYRGFLSNAGEMYMAESRLASQYLAITQRAAWPTTLTRFIKDRPFVVNPGGYFPLKPGESVESYMGEGPLPQVGEAWDRIKYAIKQSSLGAAAGQSQPGVRSASMLAIMQGVDKNKVMPALRNLARGVERALTIVEVLLETKMAGRTVVLPILKPDQEGLDHPRSSKVVALSDREIKGYYEKTVDFGPRFGPDVLERAAALAQLVKDRFISRRTAWVLTPELIQTVTSEEDQLYLEASEQHPMMVLAHAARRLQAYDPQMFDLMVQLGAFDPSAAMGGGGAPSQGGNSTAAPPKAGSAPAQGANAGLPQAGASENGQPQQVGRAVAGATPVQSATLPTGG